MEPICFDPYVFNSKLCKCVEKKLSKKKECPPGKVLNEKTNRCINAPKTKENIPKVCPPGKVLNEKTNRCINAPKPKKSKKKNSVKKNSVGKNSIKKNSIIKKKSILPSPTKIVSIKSNTPILQLTLGNKIAKELSSPNKSPLKKVKEIDTILTAFSPLINQQLVSKVKGRPKGNIIECAQDRYDIVSYKIPKIMIDGKCVSYFSSKAQKLLLDRLKYTNKNLKVSDVTAPKQKLSNCWFNAMFMIFFISNKGRKFFKYLRQLMIEGKNINGDKINTKLRNVLARFNLAIEHSMTNRQDILDTYDTNDLIEGIYYNIPLSFRKKNEYIKKKGESSNPLLFYFALVSYLNNSDSVNIKRLPFWYNYEINIDGNIEETVYEKIDHNNPPDIIVVELMDSISTGYIFDKKELVLPKNKNIKYKLDSAVVRDTQTKHFCALLEIGDDECGFDGVSYRKLSKFNWKQKLGKNENFTFEGSNWYGTDNKIIWNFRDGYQMLFFYRTS